MSLIIIAYCNYRRSGLISLEILFRKLDDRRSVYTDALFELLEIQHDGRITFSEFLLFVVTYGLWTQDEILKC